MSRMMRCMCLYIVLVSIMLKHCVGQTPVTSKFEGDSLTLECSKTHTASLPVFLIHKNPAGVHRQVLPDNKRVIKTGQQYRILHLSSHDNGDYFCQGYTRAGKHTTEQVATLVVIGAPEEDQEGSKPYVVFKFKSPVRIPVTRNNNTEIRIDIRGLQPAQIRWLKDTDIEISSSRQKLQLSEDGKTLTLTPPYTLREAGNYEVMACNKIGCTLRAFQVYIEGYTGIPEAKAKGLPFLTRKNMLMGLFSAAFTAILIPTCVICSSNWKRWKLAKRLKDEAKNVNDQMQRGSDAANQELWGWRNNEGMSSGSEPDLADYDDPLYARKTHKKKAKDTQQEHEKLAPPSGLYTSSTKSMQNVSASNIYEELPLTYSVSSVQPPQEHLSVPPPPPPPPPP